MSRLNWDIPRDYEVGVDQGVFYPSTGSPEVWNGLVSVTEKPVELDARIRYVDGRKVVNQRREDSFSATIQAFTCPSSFLRNPRLPFGMSYRVQTAKGYKIHIVYNALAYIPNRNFTQADIPEPISFDIFTKPMTVPEVAPTAHIVIDSTIAYPGVLTTFEDILYGNEAYDSRFPLPDELFEIFELNALFKIIDNGDGTFTMEAPDDVFEWLSLTQVEAEWPRIAFINEDTYKIRSW